MINRCILAVSILTVITRPHLNPKGPIHERYAISCLQEVATKQFKYINSKGIASNHSVELLTIITTANMTSPGFEIQQKLIQRLNVMLKFNIEVIENYRMTSSYEVYTTYYLIVVDSIEAFELKLKVLTQSTSFNPEAYYLVYYSTLEKNYKNRALLILDRLWHRFINNVILLIPKTLRRIIVYTMDFSMKPNSRCLDSAGVTIFDTCTNGVINTKKAYYAYKIDHNFYQCILNVIARRIDPFVINKNEGFEIEVVKEIGSSLNATMNITLSGYDSWGGKNENGSWTNGLELVYEDSYLGVGNFFAVPEYDQDFDFTTSHFHSDLVWIVPIAHYVPKWRVLVAIFSWYLWLLCIVIIVASAIFFRVTCRSKKEFQSYKAFGYDFLVAFQVIVTTAVARQPRSDWGRIVFCALAVFSIIISSVYTSSLIQYLTRPQREHQVDSLQGVFDMGWDIGGLPVQEVILGMGEDDTSKKIHNVFKVNDSLNFWMNRVATDRNTCAGGSDFFIKYTLAKEDPLLTDKSGKPKIFILPNKIISYSIYIVVNKGFPFLDRIDYAVGQMNTYGIVLALSNKYTYMLNRVKVMNEESSVARKLSLRQLQGAFVILILGYVLGFIFFLWELLINCIRKKIKRKAKVKKIKKRKT